MLISDEIPGKVAVKKVLARKQVSAEKLTMALETGVIRRRLSLLETLLKAQYLVKQKALDRIRKAKKKWIILRLRDRLRPKVEPDSGCAVEVPSVSIVGNPTSADETKVSVSGLLENSVIGFHRACRSHLKERRVLSTPHPPLRRVAEPVTANVVLLGLKRKLGDGLLNQLLAACMGDLVHGVKH